MGIHDQDKKPYNTFFDGKLYLSYDFKCGGIFMLGILYEPGEQGCH